MSSDAAKMILAPCLLGGITWRFLNYKTIRGDFCLLVVASSVIVVFAALSSCGGGYETAFSDTASILFRYLFSAATFTIVYRLSPRHPLSQFPGPFLNRISSLRMVATIYYGKRYSDIERLHEAYGPFVRIGPNSLSVNLHDAVNKVYAAANSLDKGPAYRAGHLPGNGIFFMQNRKDHDQRRRIWAPAFTTSTLPIYEVYALERCVELIACVSRRAKARGVCNLSEVIAHWTYDLMGDVVFGRSSDLNLMKNGDPRRLISSGQLATACFDILGEAPWLFDICWHLPIVDAIRALQTAAQEMMSKWLVSSTRGESDILSHLASASAPLSRDDLALESLFAIQAGSDTSSSIISLLMFYLIRHQGVYRRLQSELDTCFTKENVNARDSVLRELPYLNAVIEEGLRLGAPLPGLRRVVPAHGITLSGTFIPGGTTVSVPAWAQNVSEENFFPDPKEFKPERWLEGGLGPDSRCRRSAVMSFSFGTFSCLGKALAYQQLRLIVAHLVVHYDMKFASGFNEGLFIGGVSNMLTTILGRPLLVSVSSRQIM
ncbi:hypothetical protein HGRIS_005210 [Hohenbuehelia grisea]|uniref:Cytochrome P450 n=1 Tax=Hohenbuehelia grisea TaxID=104357 RepID=A0ABR3JF11_9AGAR